MEFNSGFKGLMCEGKMWPVEPYITLRYVSNICYCADQHLSRLIALAKLNYSSSEQYTRICWAESNITTRQYSQTYKCSLNLMFVDPCITV